MNRSFHQLSPVCAPAAGCMVVQDRIQWATGIAAGVAHTRITGGWNETDPIVVAIDSSLGVISPSN